MSFESIKGRIERQKLRFEKVYAAISSLENIEQTPEVEAQLEKLNNVVEAERKVQSKLESQVGLVHHSMAAESAKKVQRLADR